MVRVVGWFFLSLIFVVGFIVSAFLVYANLSLPKGIDDVELGRLEGTIYGDLKIILLEKERKENRRISVVESDWVYLHYDLRDTKKERPIVIPISRNFVTDFASIPLGIDWIISPFGNYTEAAVVHDWLYASGEKGQRKFADEVFYTAMLYNDVNYLRRRLMYASVRIFGNLFGGYGREEDWRFIVPSVNLELPSECEISKIEDMISLQLEGKKRPGKALDTLDYVLNGGDPLAAKLLINTKSVFFQRWVYAYARCTKIVGAAYINQTKPNLNEEPEWLDAATYVANNIPSLQSSMKEINGNDQLTHLILSVIVYQRYMAEVCLPDLKEIITLFGMYEVMQSAGQTLQASDFIDEQIQDPALVLQRTETCQNLKEFSFQDYSQTELGNE
ncbi:MAG: DUF1353 domain-containing protein [Alphaproteobacteria bacterium]|nr:DUF1353 domain-containing protein [Alphaproteobacteria bacterium]